MLQNFTRQLAGVNAIGFFGSRKEVKQIKQLEIHDSRRRLQIRASVSVKDASRFCRPNLQLIIGIYFIHISELLIAIIRRTISRTKRYERRKRRAMNKKRTADRVLERRVAR